MLRGSLRSGRAGVASRVRRWFGDRPVVVFACALATLLALFGFVRRADIDLSTDGRSYLETAARIEDGRGFGPTLVGTQYESFDTVHFPPGLPLLLAGGSRLGLGDVEVALLVNWASWLATIVGVTVLYERWGGRHGSAWRWGLLWFAAAGTTIASMRTVASEPVFIALVVWTLVCAERWLRSERSSVAAISTVGLTGAMLSVRYAGLFVLAAIALGIVRSGGGIARVVRRGLLLVLALVPMAIWYLVNTSGPRSDAPGQTARAIDLIQVRHSIGGLGGALTGYPYTLKGRGAISAVDPLVQPVLVLIGALGLVAMAAFVLRWHRDRGPSLPGPLLVDVVAIYVVGMFLYRIPSGFSIIMRYWMPIAIPMVAAALGWVASGRRHEPRGGWAAVAAGGFATFLLLNVVMGSFST